MAATIALPVVLDLLFQFVERILQGLVALEAGLPPEHHYAARLRSSLEAAKDADAGFQTGRTRWDGAIRPASRDAKGALRAFIVKARTRLKLRLGETWNSTWANAGFITASLAMPQKLAEQANLVATLGRFLQAHPEHEDSELGITVEEAARLFAAYVACIQNDDAQRVSQSTLRQKRDAAVAALRNQTWAVVYQLRVVLADGDPRWKALGIKPRRVFASTQRLSADETNGSQPISGGLQVVELPGESAPVEATGSKAA